MCIPGCEDPQVLYVDIDMGGALRVYEVNGEQRTDVHPAQRVTHCVAHGAALGLKDRITAAVAVPADTPGAHPFPDPSHALAADYGWVLSGG